MFTGIIPLMPLYPLHIILWHKCTINHIKKLQFSSVITREMGQFEKGRASGTGMVNKTIIALAGGIFFFLHFDCFLTAAWRNYNQDAE